MSEENRYTKVSEASISADKFIEMLSSARNINLSFDALDLGEIGRSPYSQTEAVSTVDDMRHEENDPMYDLEFYETDLVDGDIIKLEAVSGLYLKRQKTKGGNGTAPDDWMTNTGNLNAKFMISSSTVSEYLEE